MTSIKIPDEITVISNGLFQNYSQLREVIIPEKINYFEVKAFLLDVYLFCILNFHQK